MSTDGRIRIAYTIKSMVMGGSQTHLLQVFRFLDRERFAPVLYCLTGDGVLVEAVRALDVPVLAPAAARGFKGVDLVARIAALTQALRRAPADIVHNYLLRANLVGSISGRLARVPVVICSKRGCHERRGLELVSARIGNALADRVMVNADAVRDFVHANERCPRDKMVVVPSGIDTERFQPLAPQTFKARLGLSEHRRVVGIITRMRVRKGVEEFIRAMAQVRGAHPEAHGLIVGEVALDAETQALVHQLGLQEHLTFLGRRSDMPEVLSACDLFVLSSHDEGMSNAILEAMAMERAVVATDVGGTGEVVRHGASGLLVPPRDPQALATAIGTLLAEPARARAMGVLGRRIVEEGFSAVAMVRRMEQFYTERAAARGVPTAAGAPRRA